MKIKALNSLMVAVLFVLAYASAFTYYGGFNFTTSLIVLAVGSVLLSFVPKQKGVLQAGIYKEAWSKEVLKFVTAALKSSFLDGITDYSKYVSNVGDEAQVIHIASMNVLPEVLINNTNYPIGVADLGLTDIPISLDKFQTVATPITDDELYASTANKMELVKDRHGRAIMIKMYKRAIFNLAPSGETAKMPVLLTTGADDGTGRARLTFEDLLSLKGKCDKLEIDEASRRLVLCSDHVNDLIAQDKDFKALFYNRTTGKLMNMLSFQIDDYIGNPYFNPATKNRLSFGAIPTDADRQASVFFSLDRAAKAMGWTKTYIDLPGTQDQRTLINFRQYGIVLPTAEEMRGAIVSANK